MRHDPDFENKEPIDDRFTVLDLLFREWQSRSDRWIHRGWPDMSTPFVEVGWYCGGYTKEEHSKSYYFSVTERVVQELLAGALVSGKPEWGYTDMHELRINDRGARYYLDQRRVVDADGSHKWMEDLRTEHWMRAWKEKKT